MKHIYIIIALLAALISIGCSASADKSNSKAIEKQMSNAQETAKKATSDLMSYSYEKKAEFVNAMENQWDDLETHIEELSAKVEKSSDKVKAEAKPKLAALREQSTKLKKQITEVAEATPSTWDGIKADSSKAYAALKDSLAQSRQWLANLISG